MAMRIPESDTHVSIYLVNNSHGGFVGECGDPGFPPVRKGTTVGQLFQDRVGGDPSGAGYKIRVNSQDVGKEGSVTAHYVLRHGDRVSFAPQKLPGAAS